MFVRTENGIYEVVEEVESVIDNKVVGYNCIFNYCDEQRVDFVPMVDVIKSSENLEDLIKGGDLIIVSDSNDNKYPMIYEKYYFDCWLKTHDNLISKIEWYIKDGNNYKLVATKQGKGDWELYERN